MMNGFAKMRAGRWAASTMMLAAMLVVVGMVGAQTPPRPFDGVTLRVLSHDSFNFSEDVLTAFEAETGITVQVLRAGDTGSMVNQAILTRRNPLADVLYGVDNTFLGRALVADIFLPYTSPLLADVDPAFLLEGDARVTPINYGDVALNYDVAYFADNDLAVPSTFEDLIDPAYRGLLVVQNPATSSPGLAFLLATIAHFGEDDAYTWQDYWADLIANDVLIVEDWTAAYYGAFTVASEDGDRPLVVSYASSPPAEVIFADPPRDDAPSATVVAAGMAFRQVEYAGILRGTEHEAAAQAFIDFLLSVPFQQDMPLTMFVFPVNTQAALPDVFVEFADIPQAPVTLDAALIDANRDAWIAAWTNLALR